MLEDDIKKSRYIGVINMSLACINFSNSSIKILTLGGLSNVREKNK